MQFCIQDFLFSFQNLIGKKLFFYIFKSDSCNSICKTFSCISLFTEEKLLLVCNKGKRAYLLQNRMKFYGYKNTKALEGGNFFSDVEAQ